VEYCDTQNNLLWNQQLHYHVHKNSYETLWQGSWMHSTCSSPVSLITIITGPFHISSGLPCALFLHISDQNFVYVPSHHARYMLHSTDPYHPNIRWNLRNSFHAPVTFSLLDPKVLLGTLFSHSFYAFFFLLSILVILIFQFLYRR
jgi:hypothetical protein